MFCKCLRLISDSLVVLMFVYVIVICVFGLWCVVCIFSCLLLFVLIVLWYSFYMKCCSVVGLVLMIRFLFDRW